MQGIMETLFDLVYLSIVLYMGITMSRGSQRGSSSHLFGIMAVILGVGDAFHLVPRSYALLTTGLAANAVALGIGKLITSITMTVFYIIVYHIWLQRYQSKQMKSLTFVYHALAVARIALCLFPQNHWLSHSAPTSWGIYRNIPFAIMGLIIIALFSRTARKHGDAFKHMSIAVTLSFLFYIPVVLWADAVPIIGMLMIPKTLAYVWIVWMGWSEFRSAVTNGSICSSTQSISA